MSAAREIDDECPGPAMPVADRQPRGPRAGVAVGAGAIGRRPGPPLSVPDTWPVLAT